MPGDPEFMERLGKAIELFKEDKATYLSRLDHRLRGWVTNEAFCWLKHPMFMLITPEDPETLNYRFKKKEEYVREALLEGDLSAALIMFESPYRLQILCDMVWSGLLDDDGSNEVTLTGMGWGTFEVGVVTCAQYAEALGDAWMHTELPGRYPKKQLLMLFKEAGWTTDVFEPDGIALSPRPNMPIKLFRGVHHPKHRLGLAWTTDPSKAEWFAKRWASGPVNYVFEVDCPPERLLGRFIGRDESEYVADVRRLKYKTHEVRKE
jgi:hypothetical protein